MCRLNFQLCYSKYRSRDGCGIKPMCTLWTCVSVFTFSLTMIVFPRIKKKYWIWWLGINQPLCSVFLKAVLVLITSSGISSVITTFGLLRDDLIVKHMTGIRGGGTLDCGTKVSLPNPQFYFCFLFGIYAISAGLRLWWASVYILHS